MKLIFAEVITIGDEILYGQITDTNTQWISAELDKIGIKTIRKSSVGDQEERILEILHEAESRADIILITGGLGPTKDDITKTTLSKYFNSRLVIHEEALLDVRDFFEKRGRELTDINRQQAALPENCTYIANKMGTAPGMWFEKNGKIFISMPGVPFEMKWLMTESMLPKLRAYFRTPIIYHKILRTVGIGESYLATTIEQWEDNLPPHIRLAYLPSMSQVKLRLTATGDNLEALKQEVEDQIAAVMPLIQPFVFGFNEDELEKVVGTMLLNKNLTLATAESCTGGYIAHLITKVPGSSRYFRGGVIPYSNDLKVQLLGVKPETLEQFGAVSEETIRQMAEGVRLHAGTDVGIASSGIAGPDGGTEEKPVGTVWIACSDGQHTEVRLLKLGHTRELNIQQTAVASLNLLRQTLTKNQ